MSTTLNKQLIEQLFNEGMNARNFTLLDKIIAPTFINHGIPDAKTGPAGFKEIVQNFLEGFPDMKITLLSVIGDEDTVATRGTWTGTNKGSFMGIPPTGKQVRVDYIDFWKIKDGKAVENWVQMDIAGLMGQLGALPAPAGARKEAAK